MNSQTDSKSEISANHQDFLEISSKHNASSCCLLARGVRFEPTSTTCVKVSLLQTRPKNLRALSHTCARYLAIQRLKYEGQIEIMFQETIRSEFIDVNTNFFRVINGRVWALRTGDERKILLKAERTAVLEARNIWDFVLFQCRVSIFFVRCFLGRNEAYVRNELSSYASLLIS